MQECFFSIDRFMEKGREENSTSLHFQGLHVRKDYLGKDIPLLSCYSPLFNCYFCIHNLQSTGCRKKIKLHVANTGHVKYTEIWFKLSSQPSRINSLYASQFRSVSHFGCYTNNVFDCCTF